MTDEGNGAAQKTGEAIAPKTFTGHLPQKHNTVEGVAASACQGQDGQIKNALLPHKYSPSQRSLPLTRR